MLCGGVLLLVELLLLVALTISRASNETTGRMHHLLLLVSYRLLVRMVRLGVDV